jgi:hypothetical protein
MISSSIARVELLLQPDKTAASSDIEASKQQAETTVQQYNAVMNDTIIPLMRKFDQSSLSVLGPTAKPLPQDKVLHTRLVDKATEMKELYTTVKQRAQYLEELLQKLKNMSSNSCVASLEDLRRVAKKYEPMYRMYESKLAEAKGLFDEPSIKADMANLAKASQELSDSRNTVLARMNISANITLKGITLKHLKNKEEQYDNAREKLLSNTVYTTKLSPLLETLHTISEEVNAKMEELAVDAENLVRMCGTSYEDQILQIVSTLKVTDKEAENTFATKDQELGQMLYTTREPFMYLWLLKSDSYKLKQPITFDFYQQHMEALEQVVMESKKVCASVKGNYKDNINNFVTLRKNYGIGSPQYQSDLPRMSCAIQALLRDMQHEASKHNSTLGMAKQGITSVLKPHFMLSDSSVEGVTWNVGFEGEPDVALLKYGVNKDVNATSSLTEYVPDISVNLIHEIVVGYLLNTLSNLTPNFMYYYGGFVCSVPLSSDPDVTSVKTNYNFDDLCSTVSAANSTVVAMFELVPQAKPLGEFTVDTFLAGALSTVDYTQILAQVFASLDIAHTKLGFIHGDLHGGNILVTKLTKPEPSIRYTLSNGQTIELNNVNYLVKIIDYGFSTIKHPQLAKRLHPLRYEHDGMSTYYLVHKYQNALLSDTEFSPEFLDFARVMESIFYRYQVATTTTKSGVLNDAHVKFLKDLTKRYAVSFPHGKGNWVGYFDDLIEEMCDASRNTQRAATCDDTDPTLVTHWKRIEQGLNTVFNGRKASTSPLVPPASVFGGSKYTSMPNFIIFDLQSIEPSAFVVVSSP